MENCRDLEEVFFKKNKIKAHKGASFNTLSLYTFYI